MVIKRVSNILKLLRLKQWIKNGVIFAPLIFSGNLLNSEWLEKVIISAILFCFVSSSVYIINDIFDAEKDRRHPKKCKRPIASGEINVFLAIIIFVIILSSALVYSYFFDKLIFALLIIYFITMLLYSSCLKKIPILDVMVIASGFVLRVLVGIVAIGFENGFSPWMIMCTILISLFLALNKRKSEFDASLLSNAGESREVLKKYKSGMLDKMIGVVDSSTIMSYCLWTITGENPSMMLTIPFVIYGLFRYQYLSYMKGDLEAPEIILLTDKALLIDVFFWIVACFIIIYWI